MTAYTNIPKPTGTPYINVNGQGREQYDQENISYDSLTFYDGVDDSSYTNVAKPTGGVLVPAGTRTGLLMSLTYPASEFNSPYTKINKPIT